MERITIQDSKGENITLTYTLVRSIMHTLFYSEIHTRTGCHILRQELISDIKSLFSNRDSFIPENNIDDVITQIIRITLRNQWHNYCPSQLLHAYKAFIFDYTIFSYDNLYINVDDSEMFDIPLSNISLKNLSLTKEKEKYETNTNFLSFDTFITDQSISND